LLRLENPLQAGSSSQQEARVEIRLLGPFDVVAADRPIPLGGRRQQALLAILALRPGEVVPVGRLIEELWPEGPPDSALGTLQAYVSRLRKSLRGDAGDANGEPIVYDHGGYRLDISKDQVDAHRFERLIEVGEHHSRAGNAEEAGTALRAALALWRGPALVDFAHEPFAQVEIARLEERRLGAIEGRIDADLECGRHAALVPELEALVAEQPHREAFRQQLMVALYRSGRQGEALDVYTDTRATLDADLGIEPTPELRKLQRAILRQDPALGTPQRPRKPSERRPRKRQWAWVALAAVVAVAMVAAGVLLRPSHGATAVQIVRNSVAVVDPSTNEVVDDVVVGDYPGPVSAGNGSVWVGNIGDSTVTEIHGDTREAEFPASAQRPVDLAVTKDAIWVANATDFATQPPTGGGTITRTGLLGGAVDVTQVGPLGKPDEMSTFVTSDGRAVWAANANNRTVAKLRPSTGRILMRVAGLASAGIAAGYGAVWVPEPKEDIVVRLDTRTGSVEARIPVSGGPQRVAIGEGGVWVVTTGVHSGVWRIDPQNNETVAVIPVPPKARRVTTGAGFVWVTSGRDEAEKARRRGVLSKIDPGTNRIVSSIALGFRPDGVAVENGLVWVAIAPL
jgi:DNA-binding SARP family transcriptional activator